ncbi:MAG: adenylyltransferase/cytidyltransferase family protein [Verrucomicrobiota bacterium]|jgi:rfaE bifunctional protein nucleotidyltransferase chain/domain|nr:adenylyltransferase/cytidyltransferase family protein [Verrucomicrobiota bacterium]
MGCVVNWNELDALRAQWRLSGQRVVWTNGCFDLLHVGHLRNLQACRACGDVLVVGLNSDASVRAIKGPSRPVNGEADRAELLAGLACVDAVVIFGETTPEASLARLMPEVHCKGADYAPPHGKPIPEAAVVAAYGGEIRFIPLVPGRSTTGLIRALRPPSSQT